MREPGAGPEYPVPAGVQIDRLNLIREHNPIGDSSHSRTLLRLRRAMLRHAPDVVVPFLDKLNVAVLLALVGTDVPVIATEHLAPWMNPLGTVWASLRVATYPRAAAVVSPTCRITRWFSQRMAGRFVTCPYPIDTSPARAVAMEDIVRENCILAAGRLTSQKGFDLLLRAWSLIHVDFPEYRVEIAGEGPERPKLEELVGALGLERRARLLGHVTDLARRMRAAELFVLPSRHEAYPMVLGEALASGCAVVATDCPTGPEEMLQNGRSGVLIPPDNVQALADTLSLLLRTPGRRDVLRMEAQRRALRLDVSAVMPQWAALIESVANTSRHLPPKSLV